MIGSLTIRKEYSTHPALTNVGNQLKTSTKWKETNSTDPAMILERLFLSSVGPAQNKALLQKLKITHIVNLTGPDPHSDIPRYPNAFPNRFKYLHLCIRDEQSTKISRYFDKVHAFIDKGLSNKENCVLVHCEAGISRSSTLVISYLMKRNGMNLKQAYEYVLSRKPNIGPNNVFFAQLINYEKTLYKISSITLTDYLADQMSKGAAQGFDLKLIRSALKQAKNDPNLALNILFEHVK